MHHDYITASYAVKLNEFKLQYNNHKQIFSTIVKLIAVLILH